MKKVTVSKTGQRVLIDLMVLDNGTKPWYRFNGNGERAARRLVELGLIRDLGEELTITERGRKFMAANDLPTNYEDYVAWKSKHGI